MTLSNSNPRGAAITAAAAAGVAGAAALGIGVGQASPVRTADPTATPIKHLVVIFQENVSFDHYFATYPQAANPAGEPRFTAAPGTPSVNGLSTAADDPEQPQLRAAVPARPLPGARPATRTTTTPTSRRPSTAG